MANGVATAVPSQTARAVARSGSPDVLTDAFQATCRIAATRTSAVAASGIARV